MNNGYEEFWLNNKHYYKHRYVAEKMLGRKLKDSEVVHHIDENRSNNNPDNLMVFKTSADHSAFHKGVPIKKQGDVWVAINPKIKNNFGTELVLCPKCKTTYKSVSAKLCIKCYKECRSELTSSRIPSKDTLAWLLLTKNFTDIGKIYNVTGNAVRKWCVSYKLPYRAKDIKEIKNSMKDNDLSQMVKFLLNKSTLEKG